MKSIKILVLFTLLFSSCKKDTSTNNYTSSIRYDSNLNIEEQYTITNNLLTFNSCISSASFSKTFLTQSRLVPQPTTIDTIIFNNKILNSGSNGYVTLAYDTSLSMLYPPFVWNIKGSSEFPSFVNTITDSIPQFINYMQLPDSISRTGSTDIPLGSIYADSVFVDISDGVSSSSWGKYLPASTISITVSNPNWLQTTQTAKIGVMYYKSIIKIVSNKKINYKLYSIYTKTIKITP